MEFVVKLIWQKVAPKSVNQGRPAVLGAGGGDPLAVEKREGGGDE